jgi:hypothetical protein
MGLLVVKAKNGGFINYHTLNLTDVSDKEGSRAILVDPDGQGVGSGSLEGRVIFNFADLHRHLHCLSAGARCH